MIVLPLFYPRGMRLRYILSIYIGIGQEFVCAMHCSLIGDIV